MAKNDRKQIPGLKSMSYEDSIWARVAKSGPEDCWNWTGVKTNEGYGRAWVRGGNNKRVLAHRAVFEIAKGPIPSGLFVCHTCDNPSCCNPVHLWLGSHTDNMRDMVAKGRLFQVDQVGEHNRSAKLTDEEVRQIRSIRGWAQRAIARLFHVGPTSVRKIVHRVTWTHI